MFSECTSDSATSECYANQSHSPHAFPDIFFAYVAPKILPWTSICGNPARCYRGHGGHLSLIPLGHQRFTSTSARSHNNLGCFLGYGFWHLGILLFLIFLCTHNFSSKNSFGAPEAMCNPCPPNSSRLSKGYKKRACKIVKDHLRTPD